MNRLASVLFWSVLSAAFIGPGTVATAAAAGAGFSHALVWALLFSTFACLVLQEAAGRLTVVSGSDLGQALRSRYPGRVSGAMVLILVLGAVVLGCAAYEAGNILGGVAGLALAIDIPRSLLSAAIVGAAGLLLWFNSPRKVALALSALVAVMGVAFLATAFRLAPEVSSLMSGALRPSLPTGSSLLVVALVGTTVVPYNLFLGSGLARGHELQTMRFGLAVAVLAGGAISIGVLVVGAATEAPFAFDKIAAVLQDRLGPGALLLFSVGLFAAGLSSAVTAPLAAAMTARSAFSPDKEHGRRWSDGSWRFRSVWAGVLLVGLLFGLSGVKPIPVIIVAQALNGIMLPVVAIFLMVVVNDRKVMGGHANGALPNVAMSAVVVVCIFLGSVNVLRAASGALGSNAPSTAMLGWTTGVISAAAGLFVVRAIRHSPSE